MRHKINEQRSVRPLGKLVEKTAAHLIADQLKRGQKLRERQHGCRRRRSCSGPHHQAWNRKHITGALFMDVKSAFNNVSRGHLINRMMQLEMENNIVRWTESFMCERKVRLVLTGEEGTDHDASPRVLRYHPSCSPSTCRACSDMWKTKFPASRLYPLSTTSPGWRKGNTKMPSARPWNELQSSPGVGGRERGDLRHAEDGSHYPEQEKKGPTGKHPRHQSWGKHDALQQAGDPVAGRLAGLAADSKGAPRRKDQEGQERAEQATETCGTGRPLTRELPTSPSSMCPSSSPLRMVEGRRRPRHQNRQEDVQKVINQETMLTLEAFRTTSQPRSPQPGIGTQASTSTTRQPHPALRPLARRATKLVNSSEPRTACTSPPSERKSQESKSSSGGAQATKALKGTRWLTSGPNLPLSQMPTEWSGSH